LTLTIHESKQLQTPSYILTTKGGALNGILKHNLRDQTYPGVSLNFHDLFEYKFSLTKFKEHLQHAQH
jgi:hypothetical protein